MIPGSVSKLSSSTVATAATISPKTDVVLLTGTTSIATIIPPFGGYGGLLFLIPTAGNVGLLSSGNIIATQTLTDLRVAVLVYVKSTGKWYPHALS